MLSLLSVARSESKRLAAIVLTVLTISKDKLNLVLKKVTALISSRTLFAFLSRKV